MEELTSPRAPPATRGAPGEWRDPPETMEPDELEFAGDELGDRLKVGDFLDCTEPGELLLLPLKERLVFDVAVGVTAPPEITSGRTPLIRYIE